MIKGKEVRRFMQSAGNLAVQLLYPPRCPLCDEIRPVRGIPKESVESAEKGAADIRFSFSGEHPAQGRGYSSAGGKKRGYPESQRVRDVLEWVCDDCRKKLPWVTEPACMKCGKPLDNPQKEYCEDCARVCHLFNGGRAAFNYSGAMRKSV
ncbi:MAG: double zinc ribbon domain-containing protein [Lachnospiraceae bacterium]|nr:double zinc ribbon domain-containing protein [Lachnospiraceae bacterium]